MKLSTSFVLLMRRKGFPYSEAVTAPGTYFTHLLNNLKSDYYAISDSVEIILNNRLVLASPLDTL